MKSSRIVIWGAGYIGITTAVAYAEKGQKSIIYDIDEAKISSIENGKLTIPNLDYWCGYDFRFWFKNGMIKISCFEGNLHSNINFIAVPTEHEMAPSNIALMDVLQKIIAGTKKTNAKPVIIIESTLMPGTIDWDILPLLNNNLGEMQYILCIAPRRDWFVSADKTLKSIPRVFGCINGHDKDTISNLLSIICNKLIFAADYHSAEAVKCVENVFRYVDISIANQLALAFPELDINEVLKLAGTKWNVDTYASSFGIGGYCVPLSAQYLMNSSLRKRSISIVQCATDFNLKYIENVLKTVHIEQYSSIGILGLAYKGDIRVYEGSPTLTLVNILDSKYNAEIYINDPYYSNDEIKRITKHSSFYFPNDLRKFECLLLVTAHRYYTSICKEVLIDSIRAGTTVIDGTGAWQEYIEDDQHINYKRIGMAEWYNYKE